MTSRRWFALAGVLALLVGGALGPRLVWGTGSMTIPNTLANLAAGNQPLSVIDANFTAVANYVNTRELTIDVLSARPSASVSGRYFFANDTAGGTLYADTGSTWTQIAGSVTPTTGTYGIRNLRAGNASLTVVNASATLVNLRNPSDSSVVARTATATLSNNTLTAGPAANGRDQSAQFAASSWIHVYYIWNGTTLATLSSLCSPTDANAACSSVFGPNFPTGYTHWAYIGAWYYTSSSQYLLGDQRGASFFYRDAQVNLSSGAAVAETALNIATLVAPNSLRVRAAMQFGAVAGSIVTDNARLRLIASANYFTMYLTSTTTDSNNTASVEFPNVGQQYFYVVNTTGTAPRLSVDIQGFTVPNGAE